jgi:hypothetical protein
MASWGGTHAVRGTAWRRLAGCLAVLLVAAAATASAAGAASPTVLVQAPGPIHSIAGNSSSLVWWQSPGVAAGKNSCMVIRRRSWVSRSLTTVVRCPGSLPYGSYPTWPVDMAVGTSTIVFTDVDDEFNCCTDSLHVLLKTSTAGVRDGSDHLLTCGGEQIINVVAHGGLAAYTKSEWSPTDGTDCFAGDYMGGATETMTGGSVMMLALPVGKPRALSGAPPARFMDLSSSRLALVPYDISAGTVDAFPPPKPEIQLWNRNTRVRERTIAESGVIRALAIRGDLLAVLVDNGAGNLRIDRFSASTGARSGTTAVPATTAPMLAVYYEWVVYVVGKTVVGLDTVNGSIHTIATPTYAPRQILAVHGSAVWYALAQGRGRIVAAVLPQ